MIGGGASGMAAAIRAAEEGKQTLLLERGALLGRKLAATGNGRCNLMNRGALRYYGDTQFAEKVLAQCGITEQKAFWHRYGVLLKEESQGRMYPVTLQVSSVTEALKLGLRLNHVAVQLNTEVCEISPEMKAGGYCLQTLEGKCLYTQKVIVATGGAAAGKLGGNCSGYRMMEALGYDLIPIYPALCGIKTDRRSISGLAGIRVAGTVSIFQGTSLLHREKGEILFSEDGLSGICVMQCARFVWQNEADRIELNLVPKEMEKTERLIQEFRYRKERFAEETPEMLLAGMLPRKLAYAVCKQAGFRMRGERITDLKEADLELIMQSLQHYQILVTGIRGMDEAQVTAGGIDSSLFFPETMESKRHPGLYATGELLNVDGDCGGYNLMFAFGSGLIAGEQAAR